MANKKIKLGRSLVSKIPQMESSALGTPNSLESCDTERCGGFDSLTLRQRINYGSKSN